MFTGCDRLICVEHGCDQMLPAPRCKRAPVMKFICYKWNTRLKNFRDSEAIQEYNSILYSYVALSIKRPQQQPISLQVWLSTSFSNRYWETCKYFRSCSMQIYLMSLEAEHPVCPACRSKFRPRKWLMPIARYLRLTSGTFIWCSSLWLSRIPCSGTCVTTTRW